MNIIKSKMIEAVTQGVSTSLESILAGSAVQPIEAFQTTDSNYSTALLKAREYLNEHLSGGIHFPADANNPEITFYKTKEKLGEYRINSIMTNYRFPINSESRPHYEENWVVGDVIINNDIITNPNIGWICMEAGTPGNWLPFGYIKPWYTSIEKVDVMPDPSILQEGRQIIYKLPTETASFVYCCLINDLGNYEWVKQNELLVPVGPDY